jgi:hypothetical protein
VVCFHHDLLNFSVLTKDYLGKLSQNIREIENQEDFIRAGLRKAKRSKLDEESYRMERESVRYDRFARYLIANIGGATLLIPMIIMSFATSKTSHLIVTSIFVLGFAFLIAVGTKASNYELLGATAAYAAVLVVYVGTSSTS